MNETQHDASVNVQMAQARVNLISEELLKVRRDLTKARHVLRDAEKALDSAIRHDPASWYATPGVES